MNRFTEHEVEFFKRLKKTGKKADSEAIKFSMLMIFIIASLFVIPLINILN